MKPLFAVLKAHHMGYQVTVPQVYDAIGHPNLAQEPNWENTCAIRMSVALIAAGIKIRTGPARLRIKAGKFKGEQLEPSQRVLSDFLVHEVGKPEKYRDGRDAHTHIDRRRGIISFFQLHGTRQGHIDLVSFEDWPLIQCSSACFWDSAEVWFWELH
ncbi:T6SS effector amidase Tae4 family protein [Massilia horti]|nr:T6SS effector amidase Tae4 family protein [Massilia horti]